MDYDKKFREVDFAIKQMRKGDGRSYLIGKRKLSQIGKALEIDKIVIAIQSATILAQYIDSFERQRPTFRHSYSYDMFCESLAVGRRAAVA